MRSLDIKDISAIIENYFELETEPIYSDHADLFEDEEGDLMKIGARVLGRQMRPVLNRNLLLKERLLTILTQNTSALNESIIGFILREDSSSTVEYQVDLLNAIIAGINDKI